MDRSKETADTLATRLRAAAETIKRRRETAKLPDDWHTIDLLRSAADALDAAERREEANKIMAACIECNHAEWVYSQSRETLAVGDARQQMLDTFTRHGWNEPAWGQWLQNLRIRALAAAREGQP